jgi:hypothetical protein
LPLAERIDVLELGGVAHDARRAMLERSCPARSVYGRRRSESRARRGCAVAVAAARTDRLPTPGLAGNDDAGVEGHPASPGYNYNRARTLILCPDTSDAVQLRVLRAMSPSRKVALVECERPVAWRSPVSIAPPERGRQRFRLLMDLILGDDLRRKCTAPRTGRIGDDPARSGPSGRIPRSRDSPQDRHSLSARRILREFDPRVSASDSRCRSRGGPRSGRSSQRRSSQFYVDEGSIARALADRSSLGRVSDRQWQDVAGSWPFRRTDSTTHLSRWPVTRNLGLSDRAPEGR